MSTSAKGADHTRWTSVAETAARVRTDIVFAIWDALLVVLAYFVVEVVRFNAMKPGAYLANFLAYAPWVVVVHMAWNCATGLYGRLWRHASVEEARRVLFAGAGAWVTLIVAYPLGRRYGFERIPLMVLCLGACIATGLIATTRFRSRLFALRVTPDNAAFRVGVVGARDAGAALIREMLYGRATDLVPVAVFDDDPHSHGLSLMGIPVFGTVEALPDVAERLGIHKLLLAVPHPDPELVRRTAAAADAAGVTIQVVPRFGSSAGAISHARQLRIEDLLGRAPVATDLGAVHSLLGGKRVLITGAGGSIGSEISRQVLAAGPSELFLLDHDETLLHDLASVMAGPVTQVLADIRDPRQIERTFRRLQPQVVFHAAALKHVPLLQFHPVQAVTSNVFGSLAVAQAAARCGVERLVLISTDKAVRPSSVMGASKRIAEQIVLAHNGPGNTFCAVRFGNVLGSRGSVIPTFQRQIEAAIPVTVTDPRMTRYFMSIEEAVQLVLQSAVLARGGEVFMLDMGEPVNILSMARRMIRLSGFAPGVDVPITFTGIRPGEKLEEELHTPEESVEPTSHPSIVRLEPPKWSRSALDACLANLRTYARMGDDDGARALIMRVANDVQPDEAWLAELAVYPTDVVRLADTHTARSQGR